MQRRNSSPSSEVRPYYVSQWIMGSQASVKEVRYNCSSLEDAEERFESCKGDLNVSRVVIYRRDMGRHRSALKVWHA